MATATLALPLLPVTTGVVFPDMVVTLRADTDEGRHAIEAAAHAGDELVVVPRGDGRYASVGTVARLEQHGTLPDGTLGAVVRGLRRARVGHGEVRDTPALWVTVEPLDDPEPTADLQDTVGSYRSVMRQLLETTGDRALHGILREARSPGALADTIGWWPGLAFARQVELLETVDVATRLNLAHAWATDALAEATVTTKIAREVGEELTKTQRDAILRRQLDAIRRELGEEGDDAVAEYRRRVADLEARGAPQAAVTAVTKEIERLERTGEQNMEASWIRTWLDTVLDIPWATRTEDDLDLTHARTVLDADHTGLDEVKDRIVEFLAIRKLRDERGLDVAAARRAGTILVLVGPPGVGKTSLGESVARALGRKFVRASLGGVHDESEIRGHRRTYVGARPGRLVRALVDAGTMNPVILLDEVDKLGSDWRGDPTAALLEVLDPAQNHTFRDHYLEIELDLSEVVFVATANTIDRVPPALVDRMEVVTISGYSEREKLAIARDHLLPRVLERNAVRPDEVVVPEATLQAVIGSYTREAGVRRLEQRIDRLVRKAATRVATGTAPPIVVDAGELRDVLGPALPQDTPQDRVTRPGIATGLAVTGAGGDVLFVECVDLDGEPGLVLTGQLGDVMRESGEIALSYLRAHTGALAIDPARTRRRFHVHFPAGAVPKDGPSAGITMATALASLLTDRRVRPDLAMTGEITLQGRVLPIGGVKEKVLAAHRSGVRTVVLPEGNREDADDLPADVRAQVDLHFASDVLEVLDLALEPAVAA